MLVMEEAEHVWGLWVDGKPLPSPHIVTSMCWSSTVDFSCLHYKHLVLSGGARSWSHIGLLAWSLLLPLPVSLPLSLSLSLSLSLCVCPQNNRVHFLSCFSLHFHYLSLHTHMHPRIVGEMMLCKMTLLFKIFSYLSSLQGNHQDHIETQIKHEVFINLPTKIPTERYLDGTAEYLTLDLALLKVSRSACLIGSPRHNGAFLSGPCEDYGRYWVLSMCKGLPERNNWENLVVLFAEAICAMSDQSLGVLEEYWASLQEAAFIRLVQMFKRAVTAQLHYWTESSENNYHVKTLLEILKKLHRVNQAKCQLPENIFKVNELTHWLDFYGDAYRRSSWKVNSVSMDTSVGTQYPVIFSHFPFIFNILSKIKLLYADSLLKIQEKKFRACMRLAGIMERGGSKLAFLPTFNLTVRRSHLIEEELMVSFSGEIGHDSGGVKVEFFHCLFEEMTRPEYGMFTYPEDASYMWFPVTPKFEKRYFFFGVLCGLSLINFNVANIPFPLALFKKLLDQTASLEDLKELSPVLGKSLQTLLDDEGDDIGEVFLIYFNVHWDKNDVDLITSNGSGIIVDQTNKRDYVSKYVNYIFNISVKAVYEEFQRGFYKVCDKDIIEFFHPEELKDVFLVFLTGTDRIQVKGLKNMKITFCCLENVNEKDPIRAQTCISVLYLPKYSTMERVEEALQVAINNSRGFG
ncbi:unnamed protein product [Nyctereutes procyonoides]|uniref:(raccoon dog) hypothetical protein n=1 Tax=Nyctereutes procyonoides TaxID=34880 RepID=A0A811ZYP6_NYCPR|nr:unnamed protein product [Nyctereutes procyonoides]